MDIESAISLYGSDRWKEISALYCFDGEPFHVLEQTQKISLSSSIYPYVRINDLNNSKDAPYENKPKPAIEIGLKFTF